MTLLKKRSVGGGGGRARQGENPQKILTIFTEVYVYYSIPWLILVQLNYHTPPSPILHFEIA
jgi:hypothetical protein